MPTRINLEQNTPEWEEFRRTHIGASDIPIILGKSPFKKPTSLWEEKVTGKKGYVSKAMQAGHDLEPLAREWAEKTHSCSYPSETYLHDNGWLMASLDGWCGKHKNILEIKHANEITTKQMCDDEIPEHYLYQMQTHMEVMETHRAFLVSPEPGYKEKIESGKPYGYFMITVYRCEPMIRELLVAGEAFYNSMLNFTPPEGVGSNFVEREDKDWGEAAKSYLKAKESLKMAQEYEEICKDSLRYLAGNDSVRGAGVSVSKSIVRGVIDYSKIPELKTVDLEKYRKPPAERWNFRTTD